MAEALVDVPRDTLDERLSFFPMGNSVKIRCQLVDESYQEL
jgi:hypothetical protein